MTLRFAEALIEIAVVGHRSNRGDPWPDCFYCKNPVEWGCLGWCPGLLARRALGVA
jgi:hypothetical protein